MSPTWERLRGRNGKSPSCQAPSREPTPCLRHDLMASLKLTNETPVTMHLLLYACFCLPQPHIICPKTQPGVLSSPCDCSTHRPCVNNKNCLLLLHPVARTWFLGEGLQVLKTPFGGLSILIHTPMNTWFLTKKLKIYNGKKKASSINGADITGCQHVEEWKKKSFSLVMHKTQVQMD